MQKLKTWLLTAIIFGAIPFIRVCIHHGGIADDWTGIFLLPLAFFLIYVGMYLVGSILGIAILSVYIIFSLIFSKNDDNLNMYKKLCNGSMKNTLLEVLFRPLEILLIKYWDILRKNRKIEILVSGIITLYVIIHLLWCWGVIKIY